MDGDRGSGFLTAHSGVLDVMQDRQGGLWLGLISQGIAYLPPDWRRFSTIFESQGKPLESLYLFNTAADGDSFLVTTGEGVYRLGNDGELVPVLHSDILGAVPCSRCCPLGTVVCGSRCAMASHGIPQRLGTNASLRCRLVIPPRIGWS